jgi:hypothetical protein
MITTMELDYDLIGKYPEVDLCQHTLRLNIVNWRQCREGKLKERFAMILKKIGANFYGIPFDACASIESLIDTMRALDQQLEAA